MKPRATTTPIDAPSGWKALKYQSREAGPDYVCPRCHHSVPKSSQHVVAWPTDEDSARRHWHSNCWHSGVKEGIERYRFS
jgi:hypothetical protein